MQGKEKLTDDILSSARRAGAAMIDEATAESNASAEKLRAALADELRSATEDAQKAADAAYAGQVKLGELEAGKAMLAARQRCVAAVYDGVREKILSAPDAQYLGILKKQILAVCDDGDEVIAAAGDKRVDAAWVKKVSEAARKKLTLSKERGEFDGGVILRSAKYEKDLTVDAIVEELKEATVTETVKKLGI